MAGPAASSGQGPGARAQGPAAKRSRSSAISSGPRPNDANTPVTPLVETLGRLGEVPAGQARVLAAIIRRVGA